MTAPRLIFLASNLDEGRDEGIFNSTAAYLKRLPLAAGVSKNQIAVLRLGSFLNLAQLFRVRSEVNKALAAGATLVVEGYRAALFCLGFARRVRALPTEKLTFLIHDAGSNSHMRLAKFWAMRCNPRALHRLFRAGLDWLVESTILRHRRVMVVSKSEAAKVEFTTDIAIELPSGMLKSPSRRAASKPSGRNRASEIVLYADLRVAHLRQSVLESLRHLDRTGLRHPARLVSLGRRELPKDIRRLAERVFLGGVNDVRYSADLLKTLRGASAIWLPDLVGSGVKNRTLDALRNAPHVIATDVALEGIDPDGYSASLNRYPRLVDLPRALVLPIQGKLPSISAIVSFHNSGPYLDKCLEQLRKLDLAGHQLILIDDASTDGTLRRLLESEFAGAVISNQTNLGVAGTRNRALDQATGDYIWFVDHDDAWEPQILDELLRLTVEYDADIAICGADYRDGVTGKLLSVLERPGRRRLMSREEAVRSLLIGELQGYTWNKLFRHNVMPKEAYQAIREPKEDLARLILTLAHVERVAVTPEILYRHLDFATAVTRRMHPDLAPYERCYQMARDLAVSTGIAGHDSKLLRRFAYYQFIGPSIGTALSRDALVGAHSKSNIELLKRARELTRWRDLPGVMLRFPVQGLLAFAFKVFGFRLMWLYRLLRLS